MINYYKYLDLDYDSVSEKIRKFLEKRPEIVAPGRGAYVRAPLSIIEEVPEIFEMFKPLGLTITDIAFFVTHYRTGSIHIDKTIVPIRINFPILNCEDTETRFFKAIGNSMPQIQPNGNGYHQFHADQCELVDSFKLTKAVVMRVLEPHQVVLHHNNFPRISCTVSFKEDLSHLLI
jgi:hypothetical protein